MFKEGTSRLGFKTIDDLLELTLHEYNLMLEGRIAVDNEQAELQFFILKRAIGEVMTGKHEPLFGNNNNKKELMSKEQNHKKFKDLVDMFKKGGE